MKLFILIFLCVGLQFCLSTSWPKSSFNHNRPKRTLRLIKTVFSASSAASSASSAVASANSVPVYNDYDYGYGYGYDHGHGHGQGYGYNYGYHDNVPYSNAGKSFSWWSVKKAVLNSLFQAAKAIKGGAIAIKGKLIKGSGYLLESKGKLLQTKGEKIENVGKSLALSITPRPYIVPKKPNYYQHYHHHHLHHHHLLHQVPNFEYNYRPDLFTIVDTKPPMYHYGVPVNDLNSYHDTNYLNYKSMLDGLRRKLPSTTPVELEANNNQHPKWNSATKVKKDIHESNSLNNDDNEIISQISNDDDHDDHSTNENSFEKRIPTMKDVFYKLFQSASASMTAGSAASAMSAASPLLTSIDTANENAYDIPNSDSDDKFGTSTTSTTTSIQNAQNIEATHFY